MRSAFVILLLASLSAGSTADIVRTTAYTVKPVTIVKLSRPGYPDIARRAGVEGDVIVGVQVDADGRPVHARIIRSTNPMFEKAALDAAMGGDYSPATMPTGPVKSWIRIPFLFKAR